MNTFTENWKISAVIMTVLALSVNALALHKTFDATHEKTITLSLALATVTFMVLFYHKRCLACAGCMEIAGKFIKGFYALYIGSMLISTFIFIAGDDIPGFIEVSRIFLAVIYSMLIAIGGYVAFQILTGIQASTDFQKDQQGEKTSKRRHPYGKNMGDKNKSKKTYGRSGYA